LRSTVLFGATFLYKFVRHCNLLLYFGEINDDDDDDDDEVSGTRNLGVCKVKRRHRENISTCYGIRIPAAGAGFIQKFYYRK